MTTNDLLNHALRLSTPIYLTTVVCTFLLQFSIRSADARRSTWTSNPSDGDWNVSQHWNNGIPNGPDNTAVFATSNVTTVFINQYVNIEVGGLTFNPGANPFAVYVNPLAMLTFSGVGIMNDSGLAQNLVTNGNIIFTNEARAGNTTSITSKGGLINFAFGGLTSFEDDSSAGSATIVADFAPGNLALGGVVEFHGTADAGTAQLISNGGTSSVGSAGTTSFYDSSSAADANVITNGGTYAYGERAVTQFFDTSTAGNATVTNNGSVIAGYYGGRTEFFNGATAANGTFINNPGVIDGAFGGSVRFNDTSTAGNGIFTNHGAQFSNVFGSFTIFFNSATADHATFTNEAGQVSGAYPGLMQFSDTTTAGDAVITNNGATVSGAFGGELDLYNTVTLGNATIILNGGANGGGGGMLFFIEDSDGSTARVEVFGNAFVDLSYHNVPGNVAIGSLEGDGSVFLGAAKLTVGSNSLSTAFSGLIQNGGLNGGTAGAFAKTGTGTLTLSNANTYTGGTTVSQGALLVTNRTGSATGTGTVTVNAGIFGGTGRVSGAVTIGTATAAATLSPGIGNKPGRLTTTRSLTFNAGGKYQVGLDRTRRSIDQVVAKGVTTTAGSTIAVADAGTMVLPTARSLPSSTTPQPLQSTARSTICRMARL